MTQAAIAFLKEHGLEEGEFLCFLPNLRNAPYWEVKPGYAFDEAKHARNEEMKQHDHAPLARCHHRHHARDRR